MTNSLTFCFPSPFATHDFAVDWEIVDLEINIRRKSQNNIFIRSNILTLIIRDRVLLRL